jgi:cytoskeletal protein CcmA (bactofilin family)
MLPNFKRSETEPPKVSPSFTSNNAPPTPGASGARPLGLARPNERNAPSVIGPDLTINGNLVTKGEVQIDGEIQGDIQGTYVVIGEKARITGGIVAEEVVVRGHVMGSVRGKRVMLQSSSHVEGDIFHQALAIEQGAFFEGKSRRSDDPTGDNQQRPDIPSIKGMDSLG